ncbi:MAG: hypothetical protein H7333_12115, partial [Bdellovibrionales bacterium]|nr:hypothetical protein [Oligoflexia bacterium]
KGSLLTLGGNVLAEVFRKIEMELDAHNSAEFLRLLKKQDASTATFVSELRDWMKQLETSIPDLDES